MKYSKFLVLAFKVSLLTVSTGTFAQSIAEVGSPRTLTAQEAMALVSDGQQEVEAYGKKYSISNELGGNRCVLEDGKTMECFSESSLPYATKIFSYKGPGMKKAHFVVWFGSEDGRLLGHDSGVYFYDPTDFNSWDRVSYRNLVIFDVTVFQGRLLYLNRWGIFAHAEGSLFESGRFVLDVALGFKPRNFINLGDQLFIIGQDDTDNGPAVYRKYQYIGSGKSPIYLHDISSSELNVLIAGDKK